MAQIQFQLGFCTHRAISSRIDACSKWSRCSDRRRNSELRQHAGVDELDLIPKFVVKESESQLRPSGPGDLVDAEVKAARALGADRCYVKLGRELRAVGKLREQHEQRRALVEYGRFF